MVNQKHRIWAWLAGSIGLCWLLILPLKAVAQTDTVFWFAAPEVSISTDSNDRPVFLRLSAFGSASNVTITQPANPAFTPIAIWVAAFNTVNVNLTPFINDIENQPDNTIQNKGLYIQATKPVTAYYEVASTICNCNPEIFTLKGSNALGNSFVVPSQTSWGNNTSVTPMARKSFEIVATEPYTVVTITPKAAIVGHPANVPFTLTLQRGETYSASATGQTAAASLAGSLVSSNKPIAITIKDDQVQVPGFNCADLMGDQIVPIDVLGTEYIAVRGFIDSTIVDRLYITGIVNNTQVFLGGSTTPVTTLNQGQVYVHQLTESALYITTTNNVYILHVSGIGCEMGAALLPPINCTGSTAVSFTRTTNEYFGAILIVNAGSQDDFTLNGNPTLVNPSNFFPVPGTGGAWVAASVNWSTFVPQNVASVITNSTSYFHIGIINGNNGTGCRYGYFSNYSNLNLGGDKLICPRDSFELDAGAEKTSFLWSTGATTHRIMAKDSGLVWVEATLGNCTLKDSVYIRFDTSPNVDLGNDTAICDGASITFMADSGQYKYRWFTGSTSQFFTTSTAGMYWLEITDTISTCKQYDTIFLAIQPMPEVSLGNDTAICSNEVIAFTPGPGYAKYTWQDGSTSPAISVFKTGLYWVIVEDHVGCLGRDSVNLLVHQVPDVDFERDTVYLCQVTSITLDAGPIDPYMEYIWQDGSQTRYYTVTLPGVYHAWAGIPGCADMDTIVILTCTDFWVPNAFTPNGDGINDKFKVFTSGDEDILKYSLYIYNRWGELVFFSEDVSEGWDGTFNGKPCPQGSYNYVLIFEAAGNVLLEREGATHGHVTLIR